MTELSMPEPRIFDGIIESPRAWTNAEVTPERWRLPIPVAALAELAAVIEVLRVNPLDPRLLAPEDYPLAVCWDLMRRVEALLVNDLGVVVLDRLPVDFNQTDPIAAIGLNQPTASGPAVVGQVLAGSPAEGKLLPGDRILSIAAQPVARFSDIAPTLQRSAKPGQSPAR